MKTLVQTKEIKLNAKKSNLRLEHAMPIPKPGFLELRKYFNVPIKDLKLCGDYMYLPSVEAAVYSGITV